MSPRRGGHTEPISRAEALKRAEDARAFALIAESAWGDTSAAQQAAANAVLAAVAAVDAICGVTLGERHRGQDHRGAVALLSRIEGADDAVADFGVLIAQKDTSAYSTRVLSASVLLRMHRSLVRLIAYMDGVVAR